MRSRARLTLSFEDVGRAKAVAEAVAVDDEGYVRTRRRGSTIAAEAAANSPLSLLHTLDDYLACVSVAERTAQTARPRGRGPRRRA